MLVSAASVHAQEQKSVQLTSEVEEKVLRALPHWTFTTTAYQQEALRLLIAEANRVAQELKLAEQQPITKSNLVEVHIALPARVALGSISTSNYAYYASVGRTFSGLDQLNQVESFEQAKSIYTWSISLLNTNRAFEIAGQIMTGISMDFPALNRDSTVSIDASMPEGEHGAHFVPIYRVNWLKSGKCIRTI